MITEEDIRKFKKSLEARTLREAQKQIEYAKQQREVIAIYRGRIWRQLDMLCAGMKDFEDSLTPGHLEQIANHLAAALGAMEHN